MLHGAAGSDPGAAGSTISNGGLLCNGCTFSIFAQDLFSVGLHILGGEGGQVLPDQRA